MYLHLGQDYIVPLQSEVAVFDMDTATASKRTQALLARLQEEGRIIELYEDLPRAAVLCESALGETLYLTQVRRRRCRGGRSGIRLERRAFVPVPNGQGISPPAGGGNVAAARGGRTRRGTPAVSPLLSNHPFSPSGRRCARKGVVPPTAFHPLAVAI